MDLDTYSQGMRKPQKARRDLWMMMFLKVSAKIALFGTKPNKKSFSSYTDPPG